MRGALTAALFTLWALCEATAGSNDVVNRLLAQETPPAGVVFEIVGLRQDELEEALRRVQSHTARLRDHFPDLDVAVVSHGYEQFALTRANRGRYPELHAAVQEMAAGDAIPVHVCETHASWMGVSAEDFPDYIDVAPAGPTQIQHYEELGYVLVVVEPE